jgi:hypothetical protein
MIAAKFLQKPVILRATGSTVKLAREKNGPLRKAMEWSINISHEFPDRIVVYTSNLIRILTWKNTAKRSS